MSILDKVVEAIAPSSKEGEMNAIDLLRKDHDDVDALFKDYEKLAKDGGIRASDVHFPLRFAACSPCTQ